MLDVVGEQRSEAIGLAHVATVSFLASRVTPAGAFWAALAGGVALAQTGARHGLRVGYGASVAAMLQTVALIGPARISGPMTQALSAPLLGAMEARGRGAGAQFLACLAIRLAHYTVLSALAIWVVVGVDAYIGTYDRIVGLVGLPQGRTAALVATVLGNLVWGIVFSAIQVAVYRRGARAWPAGGAASASASPGAPAVPPPVPAAAREPHDALLDPRVAAAGTLVAFVVLLSTTRPLVLAVVAGALALAWAAYRPPRDVARVGLAFAAFLALGALAGNLIGGLGLEEGLRRGGRIGLLVLAATWLRGAAGVEGLRALSARILRRLHRVPAAEEAAAVLSELDSGPRIAGAARSLVETLRPVPRRPRPLADAMVTWVATEAAATLVPAGPTGSRSAPR